MDELDKVLKVKWKDLSFPLQLATLGGYWGLVQMIAILLFLILALTGIMGGM
jgi:hypothetical protein